MLISRGGHPTTAMRCPPEGLRFSDPPSPGVTEIPSGEKMSEFNTVPGWYDILNNLDTSNVYFSNFCYNALKIGQDPQSEVKN